MEDIEDRPIEDRPLFTKLYINSKNIIYTNFLLYFIYLFA